MLKGHATLTMSVTRRILARRWGTGRDGVGPAGVDQQGSRRSGVSREGTPRSGSFNASYRPVGSDCSGGTVRLRLRLGSGRVDRRDAVLRVVRHRTPPRESRNDVTDGRAVQCRGDSTPCEEPGMLQAAEEPVGGYSSVSIAPLDRSLSCPAGTTGPARDLLRRSGVLPCHSPHSSSRLRQLSSTPGSHVMYPLRLTSTWSRSSMARSIQARA